MITRSTLLHCRFPFSFFLLPVYLLALVCTGAADPARSMLVFGVLHLFLYPASNGYNSFYDRDTGSIGGLRNPPPVTPDLLLVTIVLSGCGILLGLLVSWQFALGALIYTAASMLYSHPRTRIKKYPFAGWLYVGIGQGGAVFLLVAQSISEVAPYSFNVAALLPAIAATFFMLGVYPLTQVYQHREDASRGDRTVSLELGCLGTFHLAAVCMTAAVAGFMYYFYREQGLATAVLFCAALAAAIVHFLRWYVACRQNSSAADFGRLMRMNFYSSSGLVLFATAILFLRLAG